MTHLQAVLDLITEGLHSIPNPPARIVQSPGALPAWDDCCEGMGYVSVQSVEASGPNGNCGPALWQITLAVGVLRCAAVLDDSGAAPSPREISADAAAAVVDLHNVAAMLHCLEYQGARAVVQSWTPQGVDGGCHGGQWTAVMRIPACGCLGTEELAGG